MNIKSVCCEAEFVANIFIQMLWDIAYSLVATEYTESALLIYFFLKNHSTKAPCVSAQNRVHWIECNGRLSEPIEIYYIL